MNIPEVLSGIASYEPQQQEILDAIKRHGGKLTQDEFDSEFRDWDYKLAENGDTVEVRREPKLWHQTDESIILGNILVSSDWQRYLHLTQLMAMCGIVGIEGESPDVVYTIKGKTTEEK